MVFTMAEVSPQASARHKLQLGSGLRGCANGMLETSTVDRAGWFVVTSAAKVI